jgi:hypothetical protein
MFDVYLACLSNAVLHRRAALQLELSVGLCIALDSVDDLALGRVTLTNVYAAAGYDCLKPDGADYKTINRRVNTAFLLFEKLTAEVVKQAARGTSGHRRVEAVQSMLEPLKLYAMDDVLAYCGRPRASQAKRTEVAAHVRGGSPTPPPMRRAFDAPDVVHVRTEHLDVPIPPSATRAELMQLVAELLKLANTFEGGRVARRRPGRARRDDAARV